MAASGSDTQASENVSAWVSPRRKTEILGLLLVVLGLLLSLAFISYDAGDIPISGDVSLGDALLNPWEVQTDFPVENVLGLVGAQLAHLLIPQFIGYGAIALSGLLIVLGYTIFRHRSVRERLYSSVLTVIGVFLFACLMGWFDHALGTSLDAWAGVVGIGVAGWMQNVFGGVGSFILLVSSAGVVLLLAIDHDIQRTVDRVVDGLHAFVSRCSSLWAHAKERWGKTRQETQETSSDSTAETVEADADEATGKTAASAETDAGTSKESERSPEPPAATAPPPASERTSGSRPVRRNDLFRWGSDSPLERTDGAPDLSPSTPKDDSESTRENRRPPQEPSESAADEREADTAPRSSPAGAELQVPDEASREDGNGDAPMRRTDEDGVFMTVQEQVEEETTDEIDRPTEAPEDVQYEPPSLDLLDEASRDDPTIDRDELEQNKRALLDKLDMYNIEIEEINAVVGPTVTRYELTPAPGIKISRIKSLEDDLAMAMAASGIRMIAPIPGKSAVGVEIPNRNRELVRLRDVIGTTKFQDTEMELPVPLGKSIEGEVFLHDLTKMPHLLIAGATGSGKSVGLNAFITGLIYACHPANLRFVVIDPKKIELQQYTPLETQFVAVPDDIDQTVITDIDEAAGVLKSVEQEMETRYDLLSDANVRNIKGYNEKFHAGELNPQEGHRHMPYLVVVVDELADLMMTVGDEVEGPISRLAQMARAVGIHLVLATQRPSVDVITGIIKANFSSRIAFEVASRVDSRTILDQGGAEGLVGNGDMLFLSGSDLRRLQGPFVSVDEVERVVEHVANQPGVAPYTLPSLQDAGHAPDVTLGVEDTDEKFEEAARIIVRRQQGSVSLLQRKLAIGYTRAARIVDQLEEAGIVGPFNGTKARDVMVDDEQELTRLLEGEDESSEPESDVA